MNPFQSGGNSGNTGGMMINPHEMFSKSIIGEFEHDYRYLSTDETHDAPQLNRMLEHIAIEAVRDAFNRKDLIFMLIVDNFNRDMLEQSSRYESEFAEIQMKRQITPNNLLSAIFGSAITGIETQEIDIAEPVRRMLGHITQDLIDGAKGELAENGIFLPRYTTTAKWLREAGLSEQACALESATNAALNPSTAQDMVDLVLKEIATGGEQAQSTGMGLQSRTLNMDGQEVRVHTISLEQLIRDPQSIMRAFAGEDMSDSEPVSELDDAIAQVLTDALDDEIDSDDQA